jgi:hypothetical protein
MHVISVGCTRLQPTEITRMQYTKFRLWSASWGWARNAQNMLSPLILNKLNRKCIMLVLLYWCTMMHGQQNVKLIVILCSESRIASGLTAGADNDVHLLWLLFPLVSEHWIGVDLEYPGYCVRAESSLCCGKIISWCGMLILLTSVWCTLCIIQLPLCCMSQLLSVVASKVEKVAFEERCIVTECLLCAQ